MKNDHFFWREHKDFVLSVLRHLCNDRDLQWEITDVSYDNDVCPSLQLDSETQSLILFLPNSYRNVNEETRYYTLINAEDYGFVNDYTTFESLEQLAIYLIDNEKSK